MEATKSVLNRRESQKRYLTKLRQYILRFRYGSDDAIIAKMESVENKTEYVRGLIWRDIHGA